MAAGEDRILKILLQLKADTAGAQQIKTELKAVEAQAAQTAAALNQTATRTIRDTSGIPAGQDRGDSAAAVTLRAQLDAQVATRNALRGIAGQTLVLDEKSLFTAELKSAAEARKVVQMERQLIMEIQLEAAEARIAGNPAMAAKLEREAAIRLQALTIQRATNVSMEVAIAQAERLVLAQEAGVRAAGVNFTRGQATALAQQLATGRVSAESMSRSFSGFGSYLSIGAVAGYSLYQALSSAADESRQLAIETRKNTDELVNQLTKWNEMAASAGDFGDVIKIGEAIQPEIEKASAKLEEFRNRELGLLKSLWDALGAIGGTAPGADPTSFVSGLEKDSGNQQSVVQSLLRDAVALRETGKEAAELWQSLQLVPLNVAIEKQGALLDETKVKYAALASEAHKLAVGTLDDTKTERLKQVNKELDSQGEKVRTATTHLDKLTSTQTKLATETEKTVEAIKKADFGKLDDSGKLQQLSVDLVDIHQKLSALGIDAPTPLAVAEALKQQTTLTKEQVEAVQKLITMWLGVEAAVKSATESQEEDRQKAQRESVNASLREQQTLLQSIHQQQQLIAAHPLLSADQKQALTMASMTAQMAALGGAIARTKQQIAGSVWDPVTHERLQAQLQRDQFEFDSLALKIKAIDNPFGTALVDWVNSMGTSAQQVSGLITNSLGTAIDGISQSITGLIIGTKNWAQAWNNAVISILGGIVKMVVQWIAGQIAMFVIRQIFGKQEASTSAQLAATSASEWAPAAVSASIASYGAASGFGVAAYIAALAAGTAAAAGASAIGGAAGGGGGFAKGGVTGTNQIAMVGEEGPEFVFTHKATRNIGTERLYAMMHAAENAPHFFEGGDVDPDPLPGAGGGNPWRDPRIGPMPWTGGNNFGIGGGYPGGAMPGDFWDFWFANHNNYPGGGPLFPVGTPGRNAYNEWVQGSLRAGGGPNTPPVITIRGTGPNGSVSAYYDPSRNAYVTASGEVVAGFDPSTGNYVMRNGQVVAGATPRSLGSGAGGGGYPRPGTFPAYLGAGFASIPGEHILGGRLLGFDSITGHPVYDPRGYGQFPLAPGSITPGHYFDYTSGGIRAVHSTPTARDPSSSGGYGRSAMSESAAMEMWYQSLPGGVNASGMGGTTDEGFNTFRTGPLMRIGADGGFEPYAERRPGLLYQSGVAPSVFNLGAYNASVAGHYVPLPHGADGLRLPGAPSKNDSILAWLAPGEHVVDAYTTALADRIHGRDWPQHLAEMRFAVDRPHFASGGRAGGGASSSSGRGGGQPIINIINVLDMKAAALKAVKLEGRVIIVDHVRNSAHEIGLGAVN